MTNRSVLHPMVGFVAPTPAAPYGSYVVAGPARTGSIGDILRASYAPGRVAEEDFALLLDRIDRSVANS